MTPVDYLLAGLVALAAVSFWTLVTATRRAKAGYEDELGYHPGQPVPMKTGPAANATRSINDPVQAGRPRIKSRRIKHTSNPTRTYVDGRLQPNSRTSNNPADSNPPIPLETQTAFENMANPVSLP